MSSSVDSLLHKAMKFAVKKAEKEGEDPEQAAKQLLEGEEA